ncbi:alpha/beta fold hydrolase [Hoeflea sp. WL0058]|uniref:Alpha/beta fold hydrolase n=1 Tax=Flavimaribacter sediminis TaxID=2865987 RepID=A0AAE2ZKW5_9HYPH|nr:alpha/beta fold hydrolase [Flavimaribacter sediminis]MBW8638403.1 alpha/beta fold hydrolase [Flavimaribacter sediminis]
MSSKTFVLVHGVWHGGWCWSRVVDILRARGHRVTAPTLTGLGERSHLLSADITLETFVADIVRHIECEDLHDIVLVGHSFGGAPVTGVADRIADRLASLIYFDGIMLKSGETWFSLLPPELAADRAALAEKTSGGVSLPPAPAESFGVTRPEDRIFLESRLTPHPFATFTTSLDLKGPRVGNGLPAAYIHCTNPIYGPANVALQRAQDFGWPVREIATGHDAMVTEPQATADLLENIASTLCQ